MKKLILILAILMLPKAFAMELEDVTTLRDSAYRVGTGDEVEIKTPAGVKEYEILEVKY